MANQDFIDTTNDDSISISEIVFHYLSYWKLFIVSIVICLVAAVAYLFSAAPQYSVWTKVLISDEKKGSTEDVFSAFQDLGIYPQKNSFDNEIEVLKSLNLLQKVADSLHLEIAYFKDKGFKTLEIYNDAPFKVSARDLHETGIYTISEIENDKFKISSSDFEETFAFGEEIVTPSGLLAFTPNLYGTEQYPITISVEPGYLPAISIAPVSKTATVISISIQTGNVSKGKDILNALVDIYNLESINEKNYTATNTINFINQRLDENSGELTEAEQNVEKYRINEEVTDLQAQGQMLLTTAADYAKRINAANSQLMVLQQTRSFITNSANGNNPVPSNEGLTDPTIISFIHAYNTEILAKVRETVGMTANMPDVKEYERRISVLRDNLLKGINNSIASLEISIRELRRQENLYRTQANTLPTKERESRGLLRQQGIKETIVNYLLQKKEETNLALAMATPNAKIIDPAIGSSRPVKPRKSIILFAALIIGVILPVIYIYIKQLFDTKIHTHEEVQKLLNAAYLGDIPVDKTGNKIPAVNLRSSLAEKMRMIASNLSFVAGNKQSKIIAVTSMIPSEGKSFVSRNLAFSLASIGKKTLLLDIDLRKSETNKNLDIKKQKGTTMYLADSSVKLEDIIEKGSYHPNLDIIAVHVYPPNPTELLCSNRMGQLFAELENCGYDYIIVDAAPFSLVSDPLIINSYTDATMFVIRAGYSERHAIKEIQELYNNNKLNRISWVLNAATSSYGSNYGKKNGYYSDDAN